MSGNYWMWERHATDRADEFTLSEHRKLSAAIKAAMRAFKADPSQTYGVDHRDDAGNLVDEIGLVNTETCGEFIKHI